ncbi:hypothetical protein C1T17_13515 [Sphingobium sp. SCG-1]|nr:hypothetical protein C1T17_13515 [Sphingobium sp. SCG-1]
MPFFVDTLLWMIHRSHILALFKYEVTRLLNGLIFVSGVVVYSRLARQFGALQPSIRVVNGYHD